MNFSVSFQVINPIKEMIKLFNMFENTSREEQARVPAKKNRESLLNC